MKLTFTNATGLKKEDLQRPLKAKTKTQWRHHMLSAKEAALRGEKPRLPTICTYYVLTEEEKKHWPPYVKERLKGIVLNQPAEKLLRDVWTRIENARLYAVAWLDNDKVILVLSIEADIKNIEDDGTAQLYWHEKRRKEDNYGRIFIERELSARVNIENYHCTNYEFLLANLYWYRQKQKRENIFLAAKLYIEDNKDRRFVCYLPAESTSPLIFIDDYKKIDVKEPVEILTLSELEYGRKDNEPFDDYLPWGYVPEKGETLKKVVFYELVYKGDNIEPKTIDRIKHALLDVKNQAEAYKKIDSIFIALQNDRLKNAMPRKLEDLEYLTSSSALLQEISKYKKRDELNRWRVEAPYETETNDGIKQKVQEITIEQAAVCLARSRSWIYKMKRKGEVRAAGGRLTSKELETLKRIIDQEQKKKALIKLLKSYYGISVDAARKRIRKGIREGKTIEQIAKECIKVRFCAIL